MNHILLTASVETFSWDKVQSGNPDGFPEKTEVNKKDVRRLSHFSERSYRRDLGQIGILGGNWHFRWG